jgi:pimeloyl-ACP methyl ester carboxylesterase
MTSKISFLFLLLVFVFTACNNPKQQKTVDKPTILILGGTPSTAGILDQIPDSVKNSYNIISFNRPGFGGTELSEMSKENLVQLAADAGLKENDFGVIGISGGAPFAIILADAFNLQHCGIISGMVSSEAYFEYTDSTFTKDLFALVTRPYEQFEIAARSFPNVDEIVQQAGAKTADGALRASYNELNFILSKDLYSTINKSIPIEWWHGEHDKNVAVESVILFLKGFEKSNLHIIKGADHSIDSRVYIGKLLNEW